MAAQFHRGKWLIPPVFQLIQQKSKVDPQEMYRVFNMGIGMVLICSPDNADQLTKALPEAYTLGKVTEQRGETRVVIK
jgi:phosphoribosylformylglycinamidine cyclo-ligase